MANKTVDIISDNLEKDNQERMAVWKCANGKKLIFNYSRNKLKSDPIS